jgi:hypothetical protein
MKAQVWLTPKDSTSVIKKKVKSALFGIGEDVAHAFLCFAHGHGILGVLNAIPLNLVEIRVKAA